MTEKVEDKKTHIRDYWRVAWQGKWTILAVAVVVTTLVTVATFMQTPIYRATAAIEIQPRAKSITPSADFTQLGVSSWSWAAEERYLNTQMEVVRSHEIARQTIDSLDLRDAPQFASLTQPEAALASRVELRLLADTYVLQISIEDTDPKMAQRLANGVAETYIESNIQSAIKNASRVIDELYSQIEPMKAEIVAKEEKRIELARTSNYFSPDEQELSIGTRINQLENELTRLQISLGEREAMLNAIEEIENRGGSFDSLSMVANDSIILSLKEEGMTLERQLEELSATFREGHPSRQAAAMAFREMPRKIADEMEKIIAKFRTEHTVEKRRANDLQKQLRGMRQEGLGLSQAVSKIETLDAEIKDHRRIYELVTTRIKEIDLNQETLVNNIRLLQRASEPIAPVRPRKALNVVAGLMLGLFLGLGASFFIDYLDNTIRSSEDVEHYLNLPLLAMMPKTDDPDSAGMREALQTLRTSVLFASKGRSLNTVHVTSAGPGEGKSRTVVNLAKTLAHAGDRVLLIDADMRRPTVHGHFGMERDGGLTNYMMNAEGGDSWRHFLKRPANIETLDVLTCGPLPPKPVELFGSERFADMIAQVKRCYDWVVIDSPPVASLADSLVLGSLVEMTIFVIKHKQNDRVLVRRSAEALRKVNTNIIGAVLNAIDLSRAAYADYYYASYEYSERTERVAAASRRRSQAGRQR